MNSDKNYSFKKILRWTVWNAAVLTCVWFAVEGNTGCGHIIAFYAWFSLVVLFITLGSDDLHAKTKARGTSVPVGLNGTVDAITGLWFLYNGWVHIGIVWIISAILAGAIYTTDPETK